MGSLFHMRAREEAFELRLLKAMGYDAVTFGNHEFDLKPAGLAAILRSAKARDGLPQIVFAGAVFDKTNPVLASLQDAFQESGVRDYIVLERDGLKIGIFGMLGKVAAEVSPFAKPLTFRSPLAVAREMTQILRKKETVDIVVCLSHGGLSANLQQGEDLDLAKKVKGIDVIISGHTHTKMDQPILVNNTLIVQAGCYGQQVGILDLAINPGRVTLKNYQSVLVDSAIAGDPAIQSMIEKFKQNINLQTLAAERLSYDQIIAETRWDIVKGPQEAGLGNLLADSIRWYVNTVDALPNDPSSQVKVAVESNGVIRDDLLKGQTGKISVGDLFRTIPLGVGADDTMAYPLISFYLYGFELKRALEIITSVTPQKGNDYFLQLSGLRFSYNPCRVIFDRVTSIEMGDEEEGYVPLDYSTANKKLYRVASNIYNASFLKLVGGFTCSILKIEPKDKKGKPIKNLQDARVDADKLQPGIQELKEWRGVIKYVQQFPDINGNGLPDMPQKYAGQLGRIESKPSLNPLNLLSGAQAPTFIAAAAAGFVLILIVTALAVVKLKKRL